VADQSEIVADQQECGALSGDQLQYFVGQCRVECAGRFVCKCQSRVVCTCGDRCRSLQHTTGPLVRVLPDTFSSVIDTDRAQPGGDSPHRWGRTMGCPGFGDMVAHCPQWVTSGVRVLRNVSEETTAELTQCARRRAEDLGSCHADAALERGAR